MFAIYKREVVQFCRSIVASRVKNITHVFLNALFICQHFVTVVLQIDAGFSFFYNERCNRYCCEGRNKRFNLNPFICCLRSVFRTHTLLLILRFQPLAMLRFRPVF